MTASNCSSDIPHQEVILGDSCIVYNAVDPAKLLNEFIHQLLSGFKIACIRPGMPKPLHRGLLALFQVHLPCQLRNDR